jgi:hypothetical protein
VSVAPKTSAGKYPVTVIVCGVWAVSSDRRDWLSGWRRSGPGIPSHGLGWPVLVVSPRVKHIAAISSLRYRFNSAFTCSDIGGYLREKALERSADRTFGHTLLGQRCGLGAPQYRITLRERL